MSRQSETIETVQRLGLLALRLMYSRLDQRRRIAAVNRLIRSGLGR